MSHIEYSRWVHQWGWGCFWYGGSGGGRFFRNVYVHAFASVKWWTVVEPWRQQKYGVGGVGVGKTQLRIYKCLPSSDQYHLHIISTAVPSRSTSCVRVCVPLEGRKRGSSVAWAGRGALFIREPFGLRMRSTLHSN